MSECKIIVVGCNHGIQPHDADVVFGDSEQVVEQKNQFANLIESLIKADGIEFIGEEWGLDNPTSAHRLLTLRAKTASARGNNLSVFFPPCINLIGKRKHGAAVFTSGPMDGKAKLGFVPLNSADTPAHVLGDFLP